MRRADPAQIVGRQPTSEVPPRVTMIDHFVRDLDRALTGPPRLKHDLLSEARDGLVDAAAAFRDTGLTPPQAEDRAIDEFGRVADLAPAYQAELVAAAAQRLALLLALVPMSIGALSGLMWRGSPWAGGLPNHTYEVLSVGVERLGTSLAVGGLLAYAWLFWMGRRGRPVTPRTARRLALAGFGWVLALNVVGTLVCVMTFVHVPAALAWPPMVIGGTAILLLLTWLTRRAWLCAGWAAAASATPA